MRRFNTIIESANPPGINQLWIDKKKLRYFTEGKWHLLGGGGSTEPPEISDHDTWIINGEDTGKPSRGEKGDKGLTPFINTDKNWWIGTTNTGVKAEGKDGDNGENGLTPQLRVTDTAVEYSYDGITWTELIPKSDFVINYNSDIYNNPDEEDITVVDEKLKFKDKPYSAATFSGLGRVYLRKNIVGNKNVLTQDMINQPNTIYHIQYDYDLNGATIIIPDNCMLQFDGGTIKNGNLAGNPINHYFMPQFFGAKGNNIDDDSDSLEMCIKCSIETRVPIRLRGQYKLTRPLWFKNYYSNAAKEILPLSVYIEGESNTQITNDYRNQLDNIAYASIIAYNIGDGEAALNFTGDSVVTGHSNTFKNFTIFLDRDSCSELSFCMRVGNGDNMYFEKVIFNGYNNLIIRSGEIDRGEISIGFIFARCRFSNCVFNTIGYLLNGSDGIQESQIRNPKAKYGFCIISESLLNYTDLGSSSPWDSIQFDTCQFIGSTYLSGNNTFNTCMWQIRDVYKPTFNLSETPDNRFRRLDTIDCSIAVYVHKGNNVFNNCHFEDCIKTFYVKNTKESTFYQILLVTINECTIVPWTNSKYVVNGSLITPKYFLYADKTSSATSNYKIEINGGQILRANNRITNEYDIINNGCLYLYVNRMFGLDKTKVTGTLLSAITDVNYLSGGTTELADAIINNTDRLKYGRTFYSTQYSAMLNLVGDKIYDFLGIEGADRYLVGGTSTMNNIKAVKGMYYFNTSLNKAYWYNGTSWRDGENNPPNILRVSVSSNRPQDVTTGYLFRDLTINNWIVWNHYNNRWEYLSGDNAEAKLVGSTTNRPIPELIKIGFQYYDTSLNKPFWWNGSSWVTYPDSGGSTMATLTFTGAVEATYNGSTPVTVNIPTGGGGTTNYEDLSNKPKIGDVELSGTKTLAQLGIQPEGDYATNAEVTSAISAALTGYATQTYVNTQIQAAIGVINTTLDEINGEVI